MTREEAEEKLRKTITYKKASMEEVSKTTTIASISYLADATQVSYLIDKIYDDFENMNCKNCVYFGRIGDCRCKESLMFDELVVDDFGCNKWEAKDD